MSHVTKEKVTAVVKTAVHWSGRRVKMVKMGMSEMNLYIPLGSFDGM